MISILELRTNLQRIKVSNIYTAMIGKYSFRVENEKMIPTLMLRNIKDINNKLVTDHLWMDVYPNFGKFKRYEIVEFEAIPVQYTRANNEKDYTLEITKIIKKVNKS